MQVLGKVRRKKVNFKPGQRQDVTPQLSSRQYQVTGGSWVVTMGRCKNYRSPSNRKRSLKRLLSHLLKRLGQIRSVGQDKPRIMNKLSSNTFKNSCSFEDVSAGISFFSFRLHVRSVSRSANGSNMQNLTWTLFGHDGLDMLLATDRLHRVPFLGYILTVCQD